MTELHYCNSCRMTTHHVANVCRRCGTIKTPPKATVHVPQTRPIQDNSILGLKH